MTENDPNRSESRVLRSFLKQFFVDEDEDAVRSLESYRQQFPEAAARISLAWSGLHGEGPTGGEALDSSFGPYTLQEEIGRGGQGIVYLATDARLDRPVAIKVLHPWLGLEDERTRQRFLREARIASRLRHSHICPVYEIGEHEARPYFVMPYVRGWNLAQILSGRPSLPQALSSSSKDSSLPREGEKTLCEQDVLGLGTSMSWLLEVLEAIASALDAAHAQGVHHRDVKPGNILITEDGRALLTDFGLAADRSHDVTLLTRSGDRLGTLPYMAPEQLSSDMAQVDASADVYALGVTLYECVCGELPFAASTPERMIRRILHDPPPNPRRHNAKIPADLAVVLEAALERDKSRRLRSAGEFAAELRRIRERRPVESRRAGPLIRVRRWVERQPALAAALFLVFLVLAAGGLVSSSLAKRFFQEKVVKEEALTELTRLSDLTRLTRLFEEFEELYPPHPDRRSDVEDWISRARDVASRRHEHEARREELRERALPPRDDDKEAYPRLQAYIDLREFRDVALEQRALLPPDASEERRRHIETQLETLDRDLVLFEEDIEAFRVYRFESGEDAWEHEQLTMILGGLDDLDREGPHDPCIKSALHILETAESLEEKSQDDYFDEWEECLEALEESELYSLDEEVVFDFQLGLAPLGLDPQSGLFEFAHVLSGDVPQRDESGRLALSVEHGIVLVLLPGGRYWQGAHTTRFAGMASVGQEHNVDPWAEFEERPVNEVRLAPFFVSKFEVTQAQWQRLTGQNPSRINPAGALNAVGGWMNPVDTVGWDEARQFAHRVNLELPTVAQWEYAARGGREHPWWCGAVVESLRGMGNLADRSFARDKGSTGVPHESALEDGYGVAHSPIGSFAPNPFGLCDVIGNVAEWCLDVWGPYNVPARGPTGRRVVGDPTFREVRGGSFEDVAIAARSAKRSPVAHALKGRTIGLRLVRRLDDDGE